MPEWVQSMFVPGLPLIEKIARPVIVYAALVILLRIFGKRELAQLNPFDLVVLLSLSNTVQNAIIGNDNSLTGGLVGACALLVVNYLVVRFLFRHRRLDEMLEGKATILIENGHVLKQALSQELMTRADLLIMLHRQGYDRVDEVQRCVLEPGGTVFIQRKGVADDERQRIEILTKLDELKGQVDQLTRELAKRGNGNV
jgi:uncharacterized membrane protein YcaP (DUF421 family)